MCSAIGRSLPLLLSMLAWMGGRRRLAKAQSSRARKTRSLKRSTWSLLQPESHGHRNRANQCRGSIASKDARASHARPDGSSRLGNNSQRLILESPKPRDDRCLPSLPVFQRGESLDVLSFDNPEDSFHEDNTQSVREPLKSPHQGINMSAKTQLNPSSHMGLLEMPHHHFTESDGYEIVIEKEKDTEPPISQAEGHHRRREKMGAWNACSSASITHRDDDDDSQSFLKIHQSMHAFEEE